ncbi:hypothetical protein DTO212C5_7353 [Paecilomyces variotii]|nr:hypothetical protein DTO212C5_7353 [Paecilomyces variotii]
MRARPLLLAGGNSSRMGFPKHLLRLPDGELLYRRLLSLLSEASSEQDVLYMSLKDKAALEQLLREDPYAELISSDTLLLPGKTQYTVRVLYDENSGSQDGTVTHKIVDIGPAAGLLAAHHHDLESSWLIVACDYPLLPISPLQQLLHEFEEPVTCFRNSAGYCEPLLAVWSPGALQRLQQNVLRGKCGPSFVVKELKGKMLRPDHEVWLFNANNKEEWKSFETYARLTMSTPE